MDKITYREARPEDAVLLAADMRPADDREVRAMRGNWIDMAAEIAKGIEQSRGACWSAFLDNDLLMIGGAAPSADSLMGGHGVPWMLATSSMSGKGLALTKAALAYLDNVRIRYSLLAIYVDARHVESIRWLRRLGFTVDERAIPAGPYGLPFHSFWMET